MQDQQNNKENSTILSKLTSVAKLGVYTGLGVATAYFVVPVVASSAAAYLVPQSSIPMMNYLAVGHAQGMAYSQAIRFAPAVASVCTMAIKGTADTAVESVCTLAGLFSGQTQDAEQNALESQGAEQNANNLLSSDSEPNTFGPLQRSVSAVF